jgi:hypothetical protein
VKVNADDTLRVVAFKICTALQEAGLTVVLTGGSAATVYAPNAYQSLDLDFVVQFNRTPLQAGERALHELGYSEEKGMYVHRKNPFTIDFLEHPLSIGEEAIVSWTTLREEGMYLHILSPTDSCRDRLAHFLFWNDRAALAQAVAIAREQDVDVASIEAWCGRLSMIRKYRDFERMLNYPGD